MNDLGSLDRLLSTAFFSACGGAGVEPAAGPEARGPGTLLSFERSDNPSTSGLVLSAHEYTRLRERECGSAGRHIDSFIVDASIFAASVTIGCRVFGRSDSTCTPRFAVEGVGERPVFVAAVMNELLTDAGTLGNRSWGAVFVECL